MGAVLARGQRVQAVPGEGPAGPLARRDGRLVGVARRLRGLLPLARLGPVRPSSRGRLRQGAEEAPAKEG